MVTPLNSLDFSHVSHPSGQVMAVEMQSNPNRQIMSFMLFMLVLVYLSLLFKIIIITIENNRV